VIRAVQLQEKSATIVAACAMIRKTALPHLTGFLLSSGADLDPLLVSISFNDMTGAGEATLSV